ncbi:TetR/AcrR family transcriptional regulator [Nocardioides sp. Y6]|uniref:TetR/AcrR family transcriptional regulator n=1 Tax=Nocardioides malaquae TaxID=2773426 RepID=A0ABR9RUN9_9ACTN|nr:TetR/AcrR family transcriptional regulator [Nocardioides malaquae]MBE7325327.1 TetR/AcrR family transcriptional regulator [Nocardioides malaquae]
MPRINAETLAEHRAQQRRAILDAARELLAEASRDPAGAAPTLAQVGRRAGLARSSLYQYFSSREALMDAVISDVFPQWQARLRAAMDATATRGEKARAYCRVSLELVAEGEHAVVAGLSVHARDRVTSAGKELHDTVVRPVVDALGGSERVAEMVQSVVWTASKQVEGGRGVAEVMTEVETVLGPFFDRLDA